MAAHHRFVWIHPFLDGNSRVGRLLTDAALRAAGLESYGAWCLSRGLAKTAAQYKTFLAGADQPRQGDLDGRGALTEKGLLAFCNYMFDTTIDQVGYVRSLLDLNALRQRIDSYVHARNDRRVPDISEPLKANAALVLYTALCMVSSNVRKRSNYARCLSTARGVCSASSGTKVSNYACTIRDKVSETNG